MFLFVGFLTCPQMEGQPGAAPVAIACDAFHAETVGLAVDIGRHLDGSLSGGLIVFETALSLFA